MRRQAATVALQQAIINSNVVVSNQDNTKSNVCMYVCFNIMGAWGVNKCENRANLIHLFYHITHRKKIYK